MSEIKISDEARECAELFNSEVLRGQLNPGGTTVASLAKRIQLLLNQRDAELAELRKENGRLAGLKYALDLVNGRRVLRRHEAYLAAIDELEAFLKAAIERTENGEEMYSVAACQTASQAGVKGGEK